jgi:hypothetical protein
MTRTRTHTLRLLSPLPGLRSICSRLFPRDLELICFGYHGSYLNGLAKI